MKFLEIDLWDSSLDEFLRCITTNGTVTKAGLNVMGAGCAKEASWRVPTLAWNYGQLITQFGNQVFLLASMMGPLAMFPVKHNVSDPADPSLIELSAMQLVDLVGVYMIDRVALPRPGCGLGGLRWENVEPILTSILDDRFTIIDYPKVTA